MTASRHFLEKLVACIAHVILAHSSTHTHTHTYMNEWCILYSALLCIAVHPKRFTIMGDSLLNHHQCAASSWMMRRLPQDNCAHHTPATGGEEREMEPIKWMGIIRRPWLTRASGGNLARTPGLHPYIYIHIHTYIHTHIYIYIYSCAQNYSYP